MDKKETTATAGRIEQPLVQISPEALKLIIKEVSNSERMYSCTKAAIFDAALGRILELEQKLECEKSRTNVVISCIKKFAHTSHTCFYKKNGTCFVSDDDHEHCMNCEQWRWSEE